MKRHVLAGLVLGSLVAASVSAAAVPSDCSARPGVESGITQTSLALPTALKVLSAGVLDATVKVVLHEGHSLDLEQNCDCRPPCEEGRFQHTSVKVAGATSAFGGVVRWEEEASDCEPGIGGSETNMQRLPVRGIYTEGTGRWFRGVDVSVLKAGMQKARAIMAFSFDTQCGCPDEPCPDTRARHPSISAIPETLHLVIGETAFVTILAADEDLQPSSISHVIVSGTGSQSRLFAVAPSSGGGPGDASAEATFSVTCLDTDAIESEVSFATWDEQGNSSDLAIPIKISRGRPTIEIVQEECRWDRGEYPVAFRVHDPDLDPDACRRQSEVLACELIDVVGGATRAGTPCSAADPGANGIDELIGSTLGMFPVVCIQWDGGAR